MNGKGIILAATSSDSGKTTVTLGLAGALRARGIDVQCAKSGPDFIDPGYLAAASGIECVNLDAWGMTPERLRSLASGDRFLLVEGAMGLFDGGGDQRGSVADLSKTLDLPIVLVIDCSSMGQSVGALANGFLNYRSDITFAGLILNKVGSDRHERLLTSALRDAPPILGIVKRNKKLVRPHRHLGLVQAFEDGDLQDFLGTAAEHVDNCVDLDAVIAAARPRPDVETVPTGLAPPGKAIALASDAAFSFYYPHALSDWRAAGAEVSFFSPLADEAPADGADAILLPGGYPELFAQDIARAGTFRGAMRAAADRGTRVIGECGGYMVLGKLMADKRGIPYPMAGCLDLETGFETPTMHLGYRHLTALRGPYEGQSFTGHEFHYCSTLKADGEPLFAARGASGTELAPMGLVKGSVSGSFAHVIDRADPA